MKVVVEKSSPCGTIQAPPSKSMAHRYLICAGLAKGKSSIENVAGSEDLLATMDCLRSLGVKVLEMDDTVFVDGLGKKKKVNEATLFCRESGSTLRFFLPICAALGISTTFKGTGRLLSRPMEVYRDCMRTQGLLYEEGEDFIHIEGQLHPGIYEVRGDISSQFISGLLFGLSLLEEDSLIRILPPVTSSSYIDLTIQALTESGVEVKREKEEKLLIKGNQEFQSLNLKVEGDASNAAFFDALNILGFSVAVEGLKKDSMQGDLVYKELFANLKQGMPKISLKNCPDLGPILFALAAQLNGAVFTDTERLRIKESDRVSSMKKELEKMNASIEVREDFVKIEPSHLQKPNESLDGHNDHRIVMALAILLVNYGGAIEGAEAVRKSMPDFFEQLRKLKIKIRTEEGL